MFELTGKELDDLQAFEKRYINNNPVDFGNCKPLVFLHLEVDETTGRLLEVGAFFPEFTYSRSKICKAGPNVQALRSGAVCFYSEVERAQLPQQQGGQVRSFQLGFQAVQYSVKGNTYFRRQCEDEALLRFIQFLAPIQFSLGHVTLVTYNEENIKLLLRKVSEMGLTQRFTSLATTVMRVASIRAWMS